MDENTLQVSQTVDVDAIIADIRRHINSAEPQAETSIAELSICDDLKIACDTFSGGHWPSGGIVVLFRKAVYRALGLKDFNGRVVAILTKIISIINGTDIPESNVILTSQHRTMNMLEQIIKRLEHYDDERIAERLSALERQIQQRQASEKP